MDHRSLRRAASLVRRVARLARRHQRHTLRSRTAPEYAGDFVGTPPMSYEPVPDDLADPGEVVWTWVPYEEDHRRGKDRPVLVVGRSDGLLLALQMTTTDHDRHAQDEARFGRYWMDVGSGDWDHRRRHSEVRVDRVLRLDPGRVRRMGAVLPREIFDRVCEQVRQHT